MFAYPLNLSFKIIAFNPQVKITDSTGNTVLYVKQKALALKESIRVFADEGQQRELFTIKANKIIDWSAQYNIAMTGGGPLGSIKREGMKSLWKATYNIQDVAGAAVGQIHEENPMLKVADALAGEIPFLNMLINPAYLVDLRGQTVLYLKKQPAFFEGKFLLTQRGPFSEAEEKLLLTSIIMALMLERQRG
jgi:uncharacterized protein YxjI